jgi:hypothetical protein
MRPQNVCAPVIWTRDAEHALAPLAAPGSRWQPGRDRLWRSLHSERGRWEAAKAGWVRALLPMVCALTRPHAAQVVGQSGRKDPC